jgi:hypothetical protein
MARTLWINAYTGHRLEPSELADLRNKAHVVYAANGHLFEDEADALVALGAMPLVALAS